ncbi:hypothetical protein [Rhodococcus sp. ARP2]|uniref:hypothetical protein n=1 Tax=Rhodococcus sp. ARP2 TaxID=1661385 RepID=UPI00064BA6C4|nr:hypothetical protein [Rhodococcus sp. ARP2]
MKIIYANVRDSSLIGSIAELPDDEASRLISTGQARKATEEELGAAEPETAPAPFDSKPDEDSKPEDAEVKIEDLTPDAGDGPKASTTAPKKVAAPKPPVTSKP